MTSAEPTAESILPTRWSERPATAWALLAVALPVGGWLLWEIHRTIGLNAPRFWELLRTDRVFDVAMLDFFLTAGWAGLVLLERASRRDWRTWVALALFCVIPSLGIAAFLLIRSRSRSGRNLADAGAISAR